MSEDQNLGRPPLRIQLLETGFHSVRSSLGYSGTGTAYCIAYMRSALRRANEEVD